MRPTWLLLLGVAESLLLSPSYNFAYYLQDWAKTESVEELATGTLTIRGQFDDVVLQILEEALQSTLKAFCTAGSILIFTEVKVLESGDDGRFLSVEFQILPPLDGGGDCAWQLRRAAEGADKGPFVECDNCLNKAPIIRTALLNQVRMYPATRNVAVGSWYLKMFSIFCRRLSVTLPRGFPPMTEKDYRCEDFFPEATAFPPMGSSLTTTPAAGSTTPRDAASSDQQSCDWLGTPCLCATVNLCSWLADGEGIGRCVKVSSAPNQMSRCESCPTLPWCPPDPLRTCPLALSICSCGLMSPQCNWTVAEGRCFMPTSGPTGVPCSLCPLAADTCPLPLITSISPIYGALLGFDGLGFDINITFDRPVRYPLLTDALKGAMYLTCQLEDGQFLPNEAPTNRRTSFRIEMPPAKREMLDDRTVRLPLVSEAFWARYECNLHVEQGSMASVAEGVPCLANEWHRVSVRDNVAPLALSFTPAAAAREVALDLQGAQITFNEPLFLISGSEARLMRLDSASGEVDTYREVQKLSLSMSSTGAEVEHLLIALGPLDPDSVYSITIPSGALVDRANNAFVGVQVGEWAFRSTIKPQVVESNAGDFPPGAIAGIIAAAVLLIAIAITGIACQRWKLVAKFEDKKTRPMEGATPKASQVKALENDTELLPSNEKYWQKALVRTQELGNGLDPELDTDGLEELPRDIPGTVNSRRPSNVSCGSNNPSNHRRPSNVSCGSNNPSNHRRPSNVSGGSNNPSNHRRPSNVVNGHSNHPSNRPNSKLSAGSQRRPSKNSADAAASSCLRQLALEGKSEVRSRSPSVDVSNASRSGRTQEEASNLAANRLAMLGAGPATLPIPHRSRSPAPRNIVT